MIDAGTQVLEEVRVQLFKLGGQQYVERYLLKTKRHRNRGNYGEEEEEKNEHRFVPFTVELLLGVSQADFEGGSVACMPNAFFCANQALVEDERLEEADQKKFVKIMKVGAALWKRWKQKTGSSSEYALFSEIADVCGKSFYNTAKTHVHEGMLDDDQVEIANDSDAVKSGYTTQQHTLGHVFALLVHSSSPIAGVFTCQSWSITFWNAGESTRDVWCFDSHRCNDRGMPALRNERGGAVLLCMKSVRACVEYVRERFPYKISYDEEEPANVRELKYSMQLVLNK
jgi:hypothetical protein